MERKAILYIALSLDGYIADKNGGVDWLQGEQEDFGGDGGIANFMATVDTVIMGRTTYEQISRELSPGAWPYEDKMSYILSHEEGIDTENIKFTQEPPAELIARLKSKEGKGIWVCGGAKVVRQFAAADLIDEYHLTIIPVVLGEGVRMFGEQENSIPLHLNGTSRENGMTDLIYTRREDDKTMNCQESVYKELTYKKAALSDIELLTSTRVQVLRAANKLDDSTDMTEAEAQSRRYYEESLRNETHAAYLVFDGDTFAGAGGVSFYQVMPTYHNPSGWKAYIMNMYTVPDYRRRGIAMHMLELLVKEAKERQITDIFLEATDMGRPLYEKYGFAPAGAEMKLQ